MDDSCAVCAETLEWVAYGACGHREVCSTCVSRLRFICDDRRCCICKTPSDIVFVTKALGDYTRMINDFSVLPSERREGQVGSYWYHEDTQAFFDDLDHYKMVKAMCKLSCSVCDKMEEQPNDGLKRRARFRNIGQLKGHLFHQHKLLMCGLCLEGRKVFICEQKLYSRGQLNQHISTGDSEVDGSESERGGFAGHPMCDFCRTPFYGDNELYTHMSTEHYTCHICQRQHPGQFDYYKNYDDLENHFGREHFLCEDEACLAKKFVVFQSEAEMKKHNTIEHGGRMSRSKRNAALQIPTSFRYRRSNEQDHHRGRGRSFHRDPADDQLSMAIQASLETATANGTLREPASSSSTQEVSDHRDKNYIDPIIQPFESLTTTDSELASRYRQALGQNSTSVTLGQSSFPPLSIAPGSNQQKSNSDSDSLSNNTMAAHLRRKNKKNLAVPSSAPAWPAASRGPAPSFNSNQSWLNRNAGPVSSNSSASAASASSYSNPTPFPDLSTTVPVVQSASYLRKEGKSSSISHSASAPNLIESESVEPSVSDFPPVSTTKLPSRQPVLNMENVHTANKSLVEKIRIALDFDEDKYTTFKDISGQYRQNSIDSRRYLDYVQQFGLSHIVLDLARLCPDARKQKELIDTYNANLQRNGLQEDGRGHGIVHVKDSNDSKRSKGKLVNAEPSNPKDKLADSFISTVRKLQASQNPSEEETEILTKHGYRATKGKSRAMVDEQQLELGSIGQPFPKLGGHNNFLSAASATFQSSGDDVGGSKKPKKTSKFHRVRLGDGSTAAFLDRKNNEPDPDLAGEQVDGKGNHVGGFPARGVWRKGGGQKLFP